MKTQKLTLLDRLSTIYLIGFALYLFFLIIKTETNTEFTDAEIIRQIVEFSILIAIYFIIKVIKFLNQKLKR